MRAGLAEPNVWLALIKTSLFGEWSWGGVTWAYLLYVLGIGLAILLAASFFTLPFYKLGEGWGINALPWFWYFRCWERGRIFGWSIHISVPANTAM